MKSAPLPFQPIPPADPPPVVDPNRMGYQPPPPDIGHPASGGFGHLGAVRYRIIRDFSSSPVAVTARPTDLPPAAQEFGDPAAVYTAEPDTTPVGQGVGIGIEGAPGDFGLPEQPLWAEALANARYPGWGPESITPGYGSPAVIEWAGPRYPRRGHPHHALVRLLLTLAADGSHSTRLLGVDLWRFKDSAVVDSVALPIDPFGFSSAVLEALEKCIFWPASDFRGNRLTGDYLISYHFCPDCPAGNDVLVSQRGQVRVRARRF